MIIYFITKELFMDKIQVTFINNNQEITKGTFDYGTKVYSVLDNFNIPTDVHFVCFWQQPVTLYFQKNVF